MVAVVGADDSAPGVVQDADVLTLGLAGVLVGSPVSSANRVAFVRTTALVDLVVAETPSLIGDGNSFALGLASVLIRVTVGPTDRKSHVLASVTVGKSSFDAFIRVVSRADPGFVFLGPCAVQVALVVVGDSVGSANWGAESLAMRTVGGFSVGALSSFPEFLLFALHHAHVLEGLHLLRANWFVDVGAVAGVHAGPLVFDHLVTTFDGADVLVSRPILSTNWSELVIARAVEVGGFCPVEVITRPFV